MTKEPTAPPTDAEKPKRLPPKPPPGAPSLGGIPAKVAELEARAARSHERAKRHEAALRDRVAELEGVVVCLITALDESPGLGSVLGQHSTDQRHRARVARVRAYRPRLGHEFRELAWGLPEAEGER